MPRLFTGLEIPDVVADRLALFAGGLAGARWVDRTDYHLTLRFFGEVDGRIAQALTEALDRSAGGPLDITLDRLIVFGGERPRAIVARAAPDEALQALQQAHERVARLSDLAPETRRFTPHVTLARLRGARAGDVAGFLGQRRDVGPLTFRADRFVLFSARSGGGGPYVAEAAWPLDGGA